MTLEKQFDRVMEEAYYLAGKQVDYWANYFIRSLRQKGGLVTAKRMLVPQRGGTAQAGFQRLVDAGRPDLAIEHRVLEERFRTLFTPSELAEAQRRVDALPKHAIRKPVPPEANHPETLAETRTYEEGAVRRVLVSVYERDPAARSACLRKHGVLCAVCEMNFEERYGEIGEGFIHVHHKKPLAACRGDYQLNPEKDLVPVCPNCHAMLHTSDPPLSVEELKAAMDKRATD